MLMNHTFFLYTHFYGETGQFYKHDLIKGQSCLRLVPWFDEHMNHK